MWWTPSGERTLQGAEADLFRQALGVLVDHVRDDDQGSIWQFNVPVFDDLQHGQKLAVLARVGKALLVPEAPAPELTAVLEGAVGVVYQHLQDAVEIEIEDPKMSESPTWRELILAACHQQGIAEELPAPDCEDLGEWRLLVECLEGEVLWDEDWRDAEPFLDAPPETSDPLKQLLGIEPDYFTEVPEDPIGMRIEEILAELRKLTQGRS